jgi:hypothetical protein
VRRSAGRVAAACLLVLLATGVRGTGPISVPEAAASVAPVPCGAGRVVGRWQVLPTPEPFHTYAVDPLSPWRFVGLTDQSVYLSDSAGCSWRRVAGLADAVAGVPMPDARFSAVTVLAGHGVLVVVTDETRTRVLASDSGEPGTWSPRDAGIPPLGAATALAAASSAPVVHLALEPTSSTLEGGLSLPGAGGATEAPILLGSDDGGRTWSRRAATGLRGPVTQLAVDERRPSVVYARMASGQVARSLDGAGSFRGSGIAEATAMASLPAGGLVAFAPGRMFATTDGQRAFAQGPGPSRVLSTAARADRPQIVVELPGARLGLLSLGSTDAGDVTPAMTLDAPLRATGGRVAGASTFQVLSGSSLLRYVEDPDVAAFPPPTRAPNPGLIDPGHGRVEIEPGGSKTVDYRLSLPRNPSPLDVFYLVDVTSDHRDVRSKLGSVGRALAASGIDIAVGAGTIGSRPRDLTATDPPLDPTYRDPSGANRPYRQPRLYELARRIGPPDEAFDRAVAAAVVPETYSGFTDANPLTNGECPDCSNLRPRGQWISLDQVITGSGLRDYVCDSSGRCRASPTFNVPPGQSAGWRQDPNVRRVIVMATPGEFDFRAPPGSPPGAAVMQQLVDHRVRVVGMPFNASAWEDLERIVRATGGFAGERVVDCGPTHPPVEPGDPLVCGSSENDGPEHILGMLRALPDVVPVGIEAHGPPGLVRTVDAPQARAVDVTVDQRLSFRVTYSCAGTPEGSHAVTIGAMLRGAVVATARADVICGHAPAAAPPPPPADAPAPARPPAPASPQLPPPAPAAPSAPAQVFQPQLGLQDAVRSQQQLQLAIASAEAADATQPPVQLAMSRRSDPLAPYASLLAACAVASAGLVAVERRRRTRRSRALRAMLRMQETMGRAPPGP